MTKGQAKPKAMPAKRGGTDTGGALSAAKDDETAFAEVVGLIRAARQRAAQAVNTAVVDLYWHIGQYLHHKIEADGWVKGTVVQLAAYVSRREPSRPGFSAQNLWRMRQFYQAFPAAAMLYRVESIVVIFAPAHREPHQAPRKTRVLPAHGRSTVLAGA